MNTTANTNNSEGFQGEPGGMFRVRLLGEEPVEPVYRPTSEEVGESILTKALRKLAFWTGLMVLAALSIVSLLVIVYRWLAHGAACVRRAVFSQFSYMYRWLDEFSPSQTEWERAEKERTLRERFGEMWSQAVGFYSVPLFLSGMDWIDWILLLAVVILTLIGLRLAARGCFSSGARIVRSWRGVHYEAMRPGSFFVKGDVPDCQVSVMLPGLLSDSHQGYGIRYGEYLIVPRHVVAGHQELILSSKRAKVAVNVTFAQSRLNEDLAYMYVGQNAFSQLGAVNAKFPKKFMSTYATCTGLPGAVSARVAKSIIRGKLVFDGSTLPGMSGAAYMAQGLVLGIHQGQSGMINVGLSADLFRAEIKYLVRQESVTGHYDRTDDDRPSKFQANWNYEEIEKMSELRYSQDDWAFDAAIDYEEQLDFGESMVRKPGPRVRLVPDVEGALRVEVAGQNTDGKSVSFDAVQSHHLDFLDTLRAANVLERIEALESRIKPKEQVAPKESAPPAFPCSECRARCHTEEKLANHMMVHKQYPCESCDKVFTGEAKLARHLRSAHPVQPESAVPEDTGKSGRQVKMEKVPFLGKKASNQNRKKSLSLNSSASAGKKGSPSVEASQCLISEFQKSMRVLLKEFAETLAGQNSATMRN
ncbi:hypothetical protein [Hubei sobemo-like virus 26]|uniref:hypothetical protein n=1 Tax=Hubei sobemo-like virus 26 TaxID=1923212 RepID=UPI00090C3AAC|nr:hypothetical protein [Hubei sobemo-like virus 26]APG75646.1 hypothetical protein [Hubei sobemo-like virus 26]